MDKLREYIKRYQWTILCVVLGLILAILLFTIGFFRTLLLLLIVGACFAVGFTLDRQGSEGVKSFFQRLFHRGDGQ